MMPDISKYISIPEGSLTWNTNWISEFESPWSIFEKLNYANLFTKKDYFNLFSTVKKGDRVGNRFNLYLLSALDNDSMKRKIGFSLKEYNQGVMNSLSGFLHNGTVEHTGSRFKKIRYWKNSLTFCLECLKNGHHSILHQFGLFKFCPYHLTPLIDHCPSCFHQYPYEITDPKHFESPYTCICGYKFKSAVKGILSEEWNNYTSHDIIDPMVKTWIHLNEDEQQVFNTFYLSSHTSVFETPQILSFLLSLLNKIEPNSQIDSHISSTKTTPYITHLKSNVVIGTNNQNSSKHYSKYSLLTDDTTDPFEKELKKDLIKTKIQTISGISKHLRKTILKDHKSCINRYVNVVKDENSQESPICPFAKAYVKWKQHLMRLDHYYDVDNKKFSEAEYYHNLSFFGSFENDPIEDIIKTFMRSVPVKYGHHSHLNWLVAHLTGFFSLKYFRRLLYNPSERFMLNDEFQLHNILLAFQLPQDDFHEFQMFWGKENSEHELPSEIVCPYASIRKRRKKPNEKSYHPMKVAIENYSRAMKNTQQIKKDD
jgi:hypothetical protein